MYTENDVNIKNEFKDSMKKEFSMTNLGKMKYFVGIEVIQLSEGVCISQRKYAVEILKRFNMMDWNYVKVPIVPSCKLGRDDLGEKT